MRRSMAAVLGSLVLTLSMVVVWPVTAGSVGWPTGGWIGAETALADDAEVEPGWYEVGVSASGTPLYRHYGSDGWGGIVTRDPWAVQVTELILELLTSADGSGFLTHWLASTLVNILVRPYVERGFQPLPSSPPTGKPAAPDAMTSSTTPAGPCDERFYHATPTVKVKGTTGKARTRIARADFWVHDDCSVRMELVWQAAGLIKGWCHILVATGTGRSAPRGVFPQEITGPLDGGTTAIDMACPAVDCRGRVEWLLGGRDDKGQVGNYLSSAPATVAAEVVGTTLEVAPLTFETGHLLFKVKKLRAEPQEPLPEPTGCPTD